MKRIYQQLNNAFYSIPTIFSSVLSNNEECTCYAKCTGDPEDDKYTAYELIFGPTEYDKLVKDMLYTCTPQEQDEFEEINSGDDGKEKSEFIQQHINDVMVADYKALVGSNRKFKHNDGIYRCDLDDDALKNDLIMLFSDVKTNGRNLNCECCREVNDAYLYLTCEGMPHWTPGWSWEQLVEQEEQTPPPREEEDTGGGNRPGNATGPYAITLDDGTSWYWYHQTTEACVNNTDHETYGRIGSCYANGNGVTHSKHPTFCGRACGNYAQILAISNLLGKEYTMYDFGNDLGWVFEHTDGFSYDDRSWGPGWGLVSTVNDCGSGYNTPNQVPDPVKLNQVLNAKYPYLHVSGPPALTQEAFDEVLENDDHYGMIIITVGNNSSYKWYSGDGHYIAISRKVGDKYYCLTSGGGTPFGTTHESYKQAMSYGMTWDEMISGIKSVNLAYTCDKSYYENDGGGGGECNGTLLPYGEIGDTGIYGILWKPDTINSSTGLIWCMPGWSRGTGTIYNNAAYISVKNGIIKPANAVFFADYTQLNTGLRDPHYDGMEITSSSLTAAINELKTSELSGCGNNLYYYGFSWGSYRFGGGTGGSLSAAADWKEAILGDGGNASTITVGNLQRVLVTQAAENNINDYELKFKDALGDKYTMVNMRDITTNHATANYYTASNNADNFKSMAGSYWNSSLPAPSYGLTWFTGGSSGGGGRGANIDADIYEKLRAGGFDDATAKRVAIIYANIAPVYGSQAALALAACSLCEGTAGQFEALSSYMNGERVSGRDYPYSGLSISYKGLRDMQVAVDNGTATEGQRKAIEIFRRLGGRVITCQQDAIDWEYACAELQGFCGSSGGQGIGFIQFSGGRRQPRLDEYKTATDFSDEARWACEMRASLAEASSGVYHQTFLNAEAAATPAEATRIMYNGYINGGSAAARQAKMDLIVAALGGTRFEVSSNDNNDNNNDNNDEDDNNNSTGSPTDYRPYAITVAKEFESWGIGLHAVSAASPDATPSVNGTIIDGPYEYIDNNGNTMYRWYYTCNDPDGCVYSSVSTDGHSQCKSYLGKGPIYPCCGGGCWAINIVAGNGRGGTNLGYSDKELAGYTRVTNAGNLVLGDLPVGTRIECPGHAQMIVYNDGTYVYIAGFGWDNIIHKIAQQGYERQIDATKTVSQLANKSKWDVYIPND